MLPFTGSAAAPNERALAPNLGSNNTNMYGQQQSAYGQNWNVQPSLYGQNPNIQQPSSGQNPNNQYNAGSYRTIFASIEKKQDNMVSI